VNRLHDRESAAEEQFGFVKLGLLREQTRYIAERGG
jgi:hypothetical protein